MLIGFYRVLWFHELLEGFNRVLALGFRVCSALEALTGVLQGHKGSTNGVHRRDREIQT